MRLSSILVFFCAAMALAVSTGCDDSKPTPPKQDSRVADSRVADQGASDDGAVSGACTAEAAKLAGTWGGKGIVEIVSGQSACLLDPNPEACIVAAVRTATSSEITDPCITCFARSAICSVSNCSTCITAPTGAPCAACRCGDNINEISCVAQFAECAGVPSTTTCPS